MIYLDNAATTFPKPPSVIRDLVFCLKKYCGNPGRSSHVLSRKSSEAIYETREEIADLLGFCCPEQVVFTYNATYGLNLAIKTLIKEKCHIITSDFEHNSVIRPLKSLEAKLGVEYTMIDSEGNLEEELAKALRPNTKAIVISIASNVTGHTLSLKLLSDFARSNSLLLIVDASQAVGHREINLKKTPCDAFVAPGHKSLFGIQGSGFVCFKDKYRLDSFIEGGSGTDSISPFMPKILPEGYEAGTLATPAIVSLGRGVRFVKDIGVLNIEKKLVGMTLELEDRLRNIPDIVLYKSGAGLLSFNYKDLASTVISSELDRRNICVRAGLHCAPSIHKKLGTLDRGAVRVSLSYLNSKGDIDGFYRAMKDISKTI